MDAEAATAYIKMIQGENQRLHMVSLLVEWGTALQRAEEAEANPNDFQEAFVSERQWRVALDYRWQMSKSALATETQRAEEAEQAINRTLDDLEDGWWPSIAATGYLFKAVKRKPKGLPPENVHPLKLIEQEAREAQSALATAHEVLRRIEAGDTCDDCKEAKQKYGGRGRKYITHNNLAFCASAIARAALPTEEGSE